MKAHVTVYAAMSIMLVISFVMVCIKSVQVTKCHSVTDMSLRLANEAVFAGYCNDLLEEFDIFAISEKQCNNKKLDHYAKNNVSGLASYGQLEYIDAHIKNITYMTDEGGQGVSRQAVEYMKYGILPESLQDLIGVEKESKQVAVLKEVTDEITKCEDKLLELDKITMRIIQLVEGIKTSDYGIVVDNGSVVSLSDYCAKSVVNDEITMKSTGIDSEVVYKEVTGYKKLYISLPDTIKDMKDNATLIKEIGDEESESYGNSSCQSLYKRSYESINSAVTKALVKTKEAINLIEKYDKQKNDCSSNFDKCVDKVNGNKDVLGEEISKTLITDINEMKENQTTTADKICNLKFIETGLKDNKVILQRLEEGLGNIKYDLCSDNADSVLESLEEYESMAEGLSNSLLKFNYSQYDLGKTNGSDNVIKELQKNLEKGIAGIILEDMDISEGSISYDNLANNSYNGSCEQYALTLTDKCIYNYYILNRFPCFTDCEENAEEGGKASEESWSELAYPLEFIIEGEMTDVDNINGIIARLSIIREGVNLLYLFTDGTKRQEAYNLALTLMGFTGNMAIIKVTQYLIMSVWAYGESIIDIRKLYKGEAIPIIKSKTTWELSLTNLLAMNFSSSNSEKKGDKKAGYMDYKDYLNIMLFSMSTVDKNYAVMSAMELRMIALGNTDFRMKNYAYKMDTCITVKLKQINQYYQKELTYEYM